MANPLQDDYVNYPQSMRGGEEIAASNAQHAAAGFFDLGKDEIFWRDLYDYLLERGYRLRPRYKPGWVAPWIGTDIFSMMFESSESIGLTNVIDARRESDDTFVAIKWCPNEAATRYELEVMRFLSSDALRTSHNHCNMLLETFSHPTNPNGVFLVSPWLYDFSLLYPISFVNEVADLMLQTFEGLRFMHDHGVAHRDCTGANIMQDAACAFPQRSHPLRLGWTEDWSKVMRARPRYLCAIRYMFIDFGVSLRFHGPGPHLATGVICRDPTAPELSMRVPFDPFALDVYLLGNFFLTEFVQKYNNLEFLRPLVVAMTRRDPASRPTIREAEMLLHAAARRPWSVPFRWRLRPRDEHVVTAFILDVGSLIRECFLQVRHLFYRRPLAFGRPPSS